MLKADLIGQRFTRLLVVGTVRKLHRRQWLCNCDCGNQHIAQTGALRDGTVKSCGCLQRENNPVAALRHGNSRLGKRTKEYRAWAHIHGRCENPDDGGYEHYGARGITVDPRWATFEAFLADMGAAPSPKHSIDRRDNDGPYSPENCRWATNGEQARNTSRTIKIGSESLIDVCERMGLSYGAVQARMRRGDTLSVALSPLKGFAYRRMAMEMRK